MGRDLTEKVGRLVHDKRMDIPWVPVATTLGLIGAIWQTVSAAISSVDSMSSFLGAQNLIQKEEQARIYRDVPAWRILRRRRLVKGSRLEAGGLLTPAEDRISRQFDREAMGWSFVIVATLILSSSAWYEWWGRA